VRSRIARNVLPVARESVRLRTAALGDDATLVGAAELGFAPLLDDPLGICVPVPQDTTTGLCATPTTARREPPARCG
jgi:hypothetical protein